MASPYLYLRKYFYNELMSMCEFKIKTNIFAIVKNKFNVFISIILVKGNIKK